MSGTRKAVIVLVALSSIFLAVGCGTVRETLPSRSAKEQLVISTAADRAVKDMPESPFNGTKVFLDTSNLEGTDKAYAQQVVRDYMLANDAALVDSKEQADVVLEMASGALSMDRRNYLLGVPELPIPIPMAGETLKFPEVALLKALFYRGKVKLRMSAVDNASKTEAFEVPVCRGKSLDSYWWILFFGPFRYGDIPMENE